MFIFWSGFSSVNFFKTTSNAVISFFFFLKAQLKFGNHVNGLALNEKILETLTSLGLYHLRNTVIVASKYGKEKVCWKKLNLRLALFFFKANNRDKFRNAMIINNRFVRGF